MPEVRELPDNTQHIHIMGVGGTAMAALAGLLVAKGYRVTGSDGNVVYPPMSDVLANIGIEPMVGYNKENLTKERPDLVIVGNVVRPVYEEAVYLVEESDIPYMSFPALLGAEFLNETHNMDTSSCTDCVSCCGCLSLLRWADRLSAWVSSPCLFLYFFRPHVPTALHQLPPDLRCLDLRLLLPTSRRLSH